MYRVLFFLILSRIDPERVHHAVLRILRVLPFIGLGALLRCVTAPAPHLAVHALGRRFESPFGIAAGFDKDATAVRGLWQLGFGHVEVGTLTARAQEGNPLPRLFRLIADRAVINRMGFNNHGAEAAARRLRFSIAHRDRPVIGANIGKSRVVSTENAVADYCESAWQLAPVADYLVVNVSSPNTPGLRDLQQVDRLKPLLEAVKAAAGATPLLVKISPDLANEDIELVCQLVARLELAGIVATNTTTSRDGLRSDPRAVQAAGSGGLSGAPLACRSLEVLRLVRSFIPPDMCVISVGGIETAADVIGRLKAGATLVQGYTGFIYEGPLWAHRINRELAHALPADQHVS
jgi:dihydroorotate dehydrogenase